MPGSVPPPGQHGLNFEHLSSTCLCFVFIFKVESAPNRKQGCLIRVCLRKPEMTLLLKFNSTCNSKLSLTIISFVLTFVAVGEDGDL